MRDPGWHLVRELVDQDEFYEQMRIDLVMRERLAFCDDHGIPYSIFCGRRWPDLLDPTVPYWTDEDRKLAVAFRMYQRRVCRSCGLHENDWVDERDRPFEAKAKLCHGCVEVLDAQNGMDLPEEKAPAYQMRLVPVDEEAI